MNLTKMYTQHGPMWVDADQFNMPRRCLTIYTSRGNKAWEKATSKDKRERLSWGVHRDNLFPTLADALANRDRIEAEFRTRP